jgi:N-acylglucosamine-6-phosphate 2-epimerase
VTRGGRGGPATAAIDVGGTKVAVGVVAADGTVLAREDLATAGLLAVGDPAAAFGRVLDRLAVLVADAAGGDVAAVGIGATGRHDVRSGRLGSIAAFLPGWDGLPVVGPTAERFGRPVALANDADAVALAEHRSGRSAGASPLVYLTLSTGVGVGTVIDGRLLRGSGGAHPEAGHQVVVADADVAAAAAAAAAPCACGAIGCWESRAGGRAIAAAWRRAGGTAAADGLDAGVAEVVAAADRGNPDAAAILARAFAATAHGLADLAAVLAPAVVLVGGGQAVLLPRMLPVITDRLALLRLVPAPEVLPATFGRDAGLVGAAAVGLAAAEAGIGVGVAPVTTTGAARMLPAPEGVAATLARILPGLRGGLIVSCQALPDEPLHGSHHMAAMARAAVAGGASAIRANGADDVAAIRAAIDVPLIGLEKDDTGAHPVRITPTVAHAVRVAAAGADVIALDATADAGSEAELRALIAAVHAATGRPVLADVSTVAEARAAVHAGADLVATTLSGYTERSPRTEGPDLDLLAACAAAVDVPVIAEGRYRTGADAVAARARGAWAVVVGGAITRPLEITARIVAAREGGDA